MRTDAEPIQGFMPYLYLTSKRAVISNKCCFPSNDDPGRVLDGQRLRGKEVWTSSRGGARVERVELLRQTREGSRDASEFDMAASLVPREIHEGTR